MVISIRSALLICAAISASPVAPAQAGPTADTLLPMTAAISPSTISHELLLDSDNVTAPSQADPKTTETPLSDAVDGTADLPTLVAQMRASDAGSSQLECLAAGVYFESKGEPLAGQLAVGEVIANRSRSSRFPSGYCEVLLQHSQFSFVHGKSWPHVSRRTRAWTTAVAIARIVDGDLKDSKVGDALFFHARRVKPGWHLHQVASIGNHIFYR